MNEAISRAKNRQTLSPVYREAKDERSLLYGNSFSDAAAAAIAATPCAGAIERTDAWEQNGL